MSASSVRRAQPDPAGGPGGPALSARDAAIARRAAATNAGYVVLHTLINTASIGWQARRVVTPDDLVDADLGDEQIARFDRLAAWRPATAEELQAAADARKAAEETGEPFNGYFIPEEPPPAAVQQSAMVGIRE